MYAIHIVLVDDDAIGIDITQGEDPPGPKLRMSHDRSRFLYTNPARLDARTGGDLSSTNEVVQPPPRVVIVQTDDVVESAKGPSEVADQEAGGCLVEPDEGIGVETTDVTRHGSNTVVPVLVYCLWRFGTRAEERQRDCVGYLSRPQW